MRDLVLVVGLALVAACGATAGPSSAPATPTPARADHDPGTFTNPSAAPAPGPPPTATASDAGVAAAPALPAGVIRITRRPPTVGLRGEERAQIQMIIDLHLAPAGGPAQQTTMKTFNTEIRQEQVLAVSGEAVTRLRVRYVEANERVQDESGDRSGPEATAGKTYVVDSASGTVVVTDERGNPAPPNEAKIVSRDYATLGKVAAFDAAIPTRPLTPGDSIDELGRALGEDLAGHVMPGFKGGPGRAVFKGTSGDEAIFEVQAQLAGPMGPMTLTLELAGEVRVKLATGRQSAIKLAGRIAISTPPEMAQLMSVTGQGTIELAATRTEQ
jgi:hypothetical protein